MLKTDYGDVRAAPPSSKGRFALAYVVRIGIVSDVHLGPPGSPLARWHNPFASGEAGLLLECALMRLREDGAEVVAILGDLSHFGDAASLDDVVGRCAAIGLPVWIVGGNHDDLLHPGALAESVERVGVGDVRVADLAGHRLRGITIAGVPMADGASGTQPATRLPWPDWGDQPVLLLTHFPILSISAAVRAAALADAGDRPDRPVLEERLRSRVAPTVIAHGHLHVRHALADGAILQVSCAALIEPPFEATLLEVELSSEGLIVRRGSVSLATAPPTTVLPVLSGSHQRWRFRGSRWSADAASGTTAMH